MTFIIIDKIITGFFVFVLGTLWFFSAKHYVKPKEYSLVIYDVFGKEQTIKEIRTTFQTQEVALGFLREYQKNFPQYQFSLQTYLPKIKRRFPLEIILKK